MRAALTFISTLGLAALLLAEDQKGPLDVSLLTRVPDLSPSLTAKEVADKFTPWIERVKNVSKDLKPDQQTLFKRSREALVPKIPHVTKLTLYSLFPIDGPNISSDTVGSRAAKLQKLPRFHDFPILGSLMIDGENEANRWVDFLRDQIIPGDFAMCDFMPRHGFRLSTTQGDVDILMCFQCDQLAILNSGKFEPGLQPVFSPAVKDQLNQLFDKLKIERDDPAKHEQEARAANK